MNWLARMYRYGRVSIELQDHNLVITGELRLAESAATRIDMALIGVGRGTDVCKVSPKVCQGNLGISRSKMPQLTTAVVKSFLKTMQKQGVRVQKTSLAVGRLKATQKEIRAHHMLEMARSYLAGTFPSIDDTIIVSEDNYILDGHHRWAALLTINPSKKINVNKVYLPIRDLLSKANNFGGITRRAYWFTKQRDPTRQRNVSGPKKTLRLKPMGRALWLQDDWSGGEWSIWNQGPGRVEVTDHAGFTKTVRTVKDAIKLIEKETFSNVVLATQQ